MEWLLQANDRTASPWLDRLSFFLGTNWIPYGYGWVFPMAGHQLKVGVCALPPRSLPGLGLHQALTSLIGRLGLSSCDVLDRHGGPVASTIHRRERMGQDSLLAVGDAASSANLLGGEGIRHAMDSADQLADCLLEQPDSLPSEQIQAIYRLRVSKTILHLLSLRYLCNLKLFQNVLYYLRDQNHSFHLYKAQR
mgnify:CR=1 FL=1